MSSDEPEIDAPLPRGTRIGRYRILSILGAGGMGTVYEAVHTQLNKKVALKVLKPSVARQSGARRRFLREARLTSRLRHPSVVDLTDVGTEGSLVYLVMELLRGEDLAQRLRHQGALPWQEVVDLLLPVCSALVAAHDWGIVHRDLKPQNIFLAQAVRGVEPKVLDFGISKGPDGAAPLTTAGAVIGTPHYLAPEQIKDARTAGPASDQYSTGVVFYKCLTDENPFEGDGILEILRAIAVERPVPLRDHRPEVPEALARVVERAMNPAPADRFASMRALGRALLPFASDRARSLWAEAFVEGSTSRPLAEERESETQPMNAVRPARMATRMAALVDSVSTSVQSSLDGGRRGTRPWSQWLALGAAVVAALGLGGVAYVRRAQRSTPATSSAEVAPVAAPTPARSGAEARRDDGALPQSPPAAESPSSAARLPAQAPHAPGRRRRQVQLSDEIFYPSADLSDEALMPLGHGDAAPSKRPR